MNTSPYELQKKDNGDIYLIPKEKHHITLIFLHGFGDYPNGYLNMFNVCNPPVPKGTKIILLCAPEITIEQKKMTSWFEFKWGESFINESGYNMNSVNKNAERVYKVIEDEVNIFNGDYKKIFIGGFSQGASLSLYIGFIFHAKLGGILSLSGVLIPQSIKDEDTLRKKNELPIFTGNGDADEALNLDMVEKSYEKIKNLKNLNRKIYKGINHSICQEEKLDIKNFIIQYSKID